MYDYTLTIYTKQNNMVKLICKKHNLIFEQCPKVHFRKSRGCTKCSKCGYSKKAVNYLNFISIINNINIQHAENYGEFKIHDTNFYADGYCLETNTIYEFAGDYWHGNPKKYDPNEINQIAKHTFGDLYQKTLDREQQIKDLGYNLIVMWESDWNKINKSIKILQRKFRNFKY